MWAKPLKTEYNNNLEVLFLSYLDHEKSGKCTSSFNLEFIKTLTILMVNKDFCAKLWTLIYLMMSLLLQSSL